MMRMKKILPPTLLIICIVIMFLLHLVLPVSCILPFPINMIGLIFIVNGVLISMISSNHFEQKKTTVMTFDIPEVLVIDGLYRYSRNPMYVGLGLIIIGIWMLLSTVSPAIVVIAYFILLDIYYIRFEEKVLEMKFGEAYIEYKARVRRWI